MLKSKAKNTNGYDDWIVSSDHEKIIVERSEKFLYTAEILVKLKDTRFHKKVYEKSFGLI